VLFRQERLQRASVRAALWADTHPRFFYALLFMLMEQMVEMFAGLRKLIAFLT
jgi:hypothetical protein